MGAAASYSLKGERILFRLMHRRVKAIWATLLTLGLVVSSGGLAAAVDDSLSFESPIASPLGDYTYGLEVGDLNRDGLDDIATSSAFMSWYVSLAQGDGRFGSPLALPAKYSNYAGQIRMGDVSGDGVIDLVGASHNQLRVFVGDGAGGFSSPHITTFSGFQAANEDSLTLNDFNNDGVLDAVVTTSVAASGFLYPDSANAVQVLTNRGDGNFNAPIISMVPGPMWTWDLRNWDLDSDGDLDLVSIGVAHALTVMWNAGDNTFPTHSFLGEWQMSDVEFADINGDGFGDLVTAGGGSSDSLRIFPGNREGEFDQPLMGGYVDEIEALAPPVDVDHDGALDVVASNIAGNLIIFHRNRSGSGTAGFPYLRAYQTVIRWDSSGRTARPYLGLGHFNSDKAPDIALSNQLIQGVNVLLRVPTDSAPPNVAGEITGNRGNNDWYTGEVKVTWTATDDVDGQLPAPPSNTLPNEGHGQTATSQEVCDAAGNCARGTVQGINIDFTKPQLADVTLSSSPLPVGRNAALRVTASDAVSGIAGGEWFLDADPGTGSATAMDRDGDVLSAVVGGETEPGVHTVGVRAQDVAGNWSDVSTLYLVAYDPTGGFATGGGWIVPGGHTSDVGDALPGLDGESKATFGFVVKYENGQSTVPGGNLQFHYQAGKFRLKSTGMDWLVVTNTNWAKFQGLGTVDGIDGKVPFRVEARDSDKIGQPDRFVIRIWTPGTDPDTDPAPYKATGDVQGGQIQIHKP